MIPVVVVAVVITSIVAVHLIAVPLVIVIEVVARASLVAKMEVLSGIPGVTLTQAVATNSLWPEPGRSARTLILPDRRVPFCRQRDVGKIVK